VPLTPRAACALGAALLLAGCGGGGSQSAGTTTAGAPRASTSAGGCEVVPQPSPKANGGARKPTERLAAGKTYKLVFDTTCGSFTVTLDQRHAPHTTASLVSLAKAHFFDGTTFHRIVPGFVIQGGDPTGTGNGGPGYSTVDVPPADATYTKAVVAMAKTATEPPGTAGSQFFVVTGANVGLPPEYAVVGKVTAGLEAVARIDKLGGPDEQPQRPVVIRKVTVTVTRS
jgi:peptidyl-prolyl cis-trans isomerase B (cyclophilin B)